MNIQTSNNTLRVILLLCVCCVLFVIFIVQKNTSQVVEVDTNQQTINPIDKKVIEMYTNALEHTKTYYTENNNSYHGVCERFDTPHSLNVTVLPHTKQLGATELYCSSSDTEFMTEAKLPSKEGYFCIDESGVSVINPTSSKTSLQCTS